ncbi:uncharacterized protein G2W53_007413 [Senna tora]|uniref:Uncharacterized protein n=1 Tax=Senna tora TaxID=362788 RepID=A0A835CDM3_9FABA|nr:uncharacterized protein G2W53_007413 [Senna tora]
MASSSSLICFVIAEESRSKGGRVECVLVEVRVIEDGDGRMGEGCSTKKKRGFFQSLPRVPISRAKILVKTVQKPKRSHWLCKAAGAKLGREYSSWRANDCDHVGGRDSMGAGHSLMKLELGGK